MQPKGNTGKEKEFYKWHGALDEDLPMQNLREYEKVERKKNHSTNVSPYLHMCTMVAAMQLCT